jgi:[acyl-carrier-protein] S-malonyltransferase/trans-AT polyketide synthase/acyltransferase/oxidoreductase domain-containing protein
MGAPTTAVFPGQGSQKKGMAAEFYADHPAARLVFEEGSDALGLDLAELCFNDPHSRLGQTEYTQPAILCAEIAIFRALVADCGLLATLFGGHSLGEYTALVAAGAIPLAPALRLVSARGRLMQQAVPQGEGAMTAITSEELDVARISAHLEGLEVDLANLNAPTQVVISGRAAAVARASAAIAADSAIAGLRLAPLPVSAPFHSRLMAPIEEGYCELLRSSSSSWSPGAARAVVSNWSGGWHSGDLEDLILGLTRQISGPVRWVDNMSALIAAGQPIIEVGPSRTLRAFFRPLGLDVESITNRVSARRVLGEAAPLPPG